MSLTTLAILYPSAILWTSVFSKTSIHCYGRLLLFWKRINFKLHVLSFADGHSTVLNSEAFLGNNWKINWSLFSESVTPSNSNETELLCCPLHLPLPQPIPPCWLIGVELVRVANAVPNTPVFSFVRDTWTRLVDSVILNSLFSETCETCFLTSLW